MLLAFQKRHCNARCQHLLTEGQIGEKRYVLGFRVLGPFDSIYVRLWDVLNSGHRHIHEMAHPLGKLLFFSLGEQIRILEFAQIRDRPLACTGTVLTSTVCVEPASALMQHFHSQARSPHQRHLVAEEPKDDPSCSRYSRGNRCGNPPPPFLAASP